MKKLRILVLTDHRGHQPSNSVYAIARALAQHASVHEVFLASRGTPANAAFFENRQLTDIHALKADSTTDWQTGGARFAQPPLRVDPRDMDLILLRLPPPLNDDFLRFLARTLDERRVVNRPSGILSTGSKAFLLEVAALCPPLELITDEAGLLAYIGRGPVVLKPLKGYGGHGIIRIDGPDVWSEGGHLSLEEALPLLREGLDRGGYLGMPFLRHVDQGDKRVIVVNGEVVGASLRLPARGHWLCNAAQGGHAIAAAPDEDELRMVAHLNEVLLPRGVLIYGMDTLMGNDGHRVLSEVNTSSIGGILQSITPAGQPAALRTAELLVRYALEVAT